MGSHNMSVEFALAGVGFSQRPPAASARLAGFFLSFFSAASPRAG
jgi:hypothetical protein